MRVMVICLWAPLLFTGCNREPRSAQHSEPNQPRGGAQVAGLGAEARPNTCSIILLAHPGTNRTDQEIARLQQDVKTARDPGHLIEKLGWLYVRKARESFDPGFYKLAEQCALCLDARQPGGPEALLLRGHVLHNLHHFKEAEAVARGLAGQRGLAADYGLLGDALMEQGKLPAAAAAYQKMVDLRPDLHSYARGAHLRWLKGDSAGAVDLMQMAARAGSPQDAEAAAWAYTRLAFYQSVSGAKEEADQACANALDFQKDYPPALLLRGRLRLARGQNSQALDDLQRATLLNPLPEYQWALAEGLRDAGRTDESLTVEAKLRQTGAASDPRTLALYLATRGESVDTALQLTERELLERADVFTQDARAWSLAAAGRLPEARQFMARALAEGTRDARLFFHATVIAAKSGHRPEAQAWLERTVPLQDLLLPSERAQLLVAAATLKNGAAAFPEANQTGATLSMRQK